MKTGKLLKDFDTAVSDKELELVNKYTRRQLTKEQVYIFSVVLCDNDVDRDFERFTVETLFELEKLFVGKTGIFDHNSSAKNQTARIISAKVESVDGRKTATGDDYFRLVCRAYIPINDKNQEIIDAIETGILKEVSVGCAIKQSLCSICHNEINSTQCHHIKGKLYNQKLCYGLLCSAYDAYEFSFVAVPAQKSAGVTKAFLQNKKENVKMQDIICDLKKCKQMTLDDDSCRRLFEYISELEAKAQDGQMYREKLKSEVVKYMGIFSDTLESSTIKSIADKLSVVELSQLCQVYKEKTHNEYLGGVQLSVDNTLKNQKLQSDQFTI